MARTILLNLLILDIAEYAFDKIYLGHNFTTHLEPLHRAGQPDVEFQLIRPYTLMTMTCRYLRSVLPHQLRRPIPVEIVESLQCKINWARPFAQERGWAYAELDNRRDDSRRAYVGDVESCKACT